MRFCVVAALLAAVTLASIGAAGSADARGKAVVPASSDAYTARLFALMNRERARHGLQPFQRGRCATAWAERWSAEMADSRRLRHQSLRSLMKGCGARRVAENIGSGAVSADDLMKQWMASRRHRANILHPQLGYAGVGAARGSDGQWYAVQNFLGF